MSVVLYYKCSVCDIEGPVCELRPPSLCLSYHYYNIHCVVAGRSGDRDGNGHDSDREGSITPTNETPPSEELLEETTTPKDKVRPSYYH